MERDFVDWVVERWAEEAPRVDTSSIQVVGRLLRIARLLEQRFDRLCRRYGLTFWGFSLLNALRRSGPPYRLSPSQLHRSGMVSLPAVTKRIARLEEMGLVSREPDPNDRRSVLIGLTPKGRELVDEVGAAYIQAERAVLAPLADDEREALAGMLRRLLLSLEGTASATLGA